MYIKHCTTWSKTPLIHNKKCPAELWTLHMLFSNTLKNKTKRNSIQTESDLPDSSIIINFIALSIRFDSHIYCSLRFSHVRQCTDLSSNKTELSYVALPTYKQSELYFDYPIICWNVLIVVLDPFIFYKCVIFMF